MKILICNFIKDLNVLTKANEFGEVDDVGVLVSKEPVRCKRSRQDRVLHGMVPSYTFKFSRHDQSCASDT